MKKCFSVFVAMIIGVSCFFVNDWKLESFAAITYECGIYKYTVKDDGTAKIVGLTVAKDEIEGSLELPDTLDGISVTAIGSFVFQNCIHLNEIVVPDSVTELGGSVFDGCNNLKCFTISKYLVDYNEAFWGSGIEKVIIEEGSTSIPSMGFYYASNLKEIIIPNSVSEIGGNAFYGCKRLKEFTISKELVDYNEAFWGSGIEKIIIEEGSTFIPSMGFYYASNLKEIIIPKSITRIYNYGFTGCKALTDVYYSGSKTQWDQIRITSTGNGYLLNANIHYNYVDINVPAGKYAIKVVNSNGEPITNAQISTYDALDSADYGVDKNGIAYIDKSSIGDLNYCVTAPDYEEYKTDGTDSSFSDYGYDIVILYTTEESELKLASAIYTDTGANYNPTPGAQNIDLVKKTKRLSSTNDSTFLGLLETGHFKLTCSARNKNKAVNYLLYHNTNIIAGSTTGEFRLSISQFSPGRGIFVRTYAADGTFVDTPLNFEICEDTKNLKPTFSFGDKITFKVPSEVPYVGGDEFSFDWPNYPVDIVFESGSAYIGLNYNFKDVNNNGIKYKNYDEQLKDFKQSIRDFMLLKNYKVGSHLVSNIEKFLKKRDKLNLPVAGKVDITVVGAGKVEWTPGQLMEDFFDKATIDVYVIINTYFEKSIQTHISVVPVTFNIKGGLKTKLEGAVNYNYKSQTLNGDILLNLNPYFSVFGGVGVGKFIGVGAYGDADMSFDIQLASTSAQKGLKKWDLTGELGLKAYTAFFEYKKHFAYHTWHLYTATDKSSSPLPPMYAPAALQASLVDESAYQVADISYLQNESGWLSKPETAESSIKKAPAEKTTGEIQALLTDTYRYSQPVLAASSDTAVLAYVGADTERSVYNLTATMYSVFDEITSTWSEPLQVDTNHTADTSPALYSTDDGIWLVYQESDREFDENVSTEEYISSQRIVVAKYNTDTGRFNIQKTFDSIPGYNRLPAVTTVQGVPYVVWLTSESSDLFGQGEANRIVYSEFKNGSWNTPVELASNLPTVTELACGEKNGKLQVAYIIDSDTDLATEGDRIVCITDASGNSTILETVSAYNLQYGKAPSMDQASFLWVEEANLYAEVNGETQAVVSLNGNPESVSVMNDRIFYTAADNDVSQIYAVCYDDAAEQWGEPIQITDQSQYIERLSTTVLHGRTLASMTRKNITITDEDIDDTCELSWTELCPKASVSINELYVDHSAVSPEQPVELTIGLFNSGSETIESYCISVIDENNETVYSDIVQVLLAPGCRDNRSETFLIPAFDTCKTYTVQISSENEAFDAVSETVTLGYTDFETSIDLITVGKANTAVVTVSNVGVASSSGVLTVTSQNKEETMSTFVIPFLAAGEQTTFFVDITPDEDEEYDVIFASVSATETEVYDHNNVDSVYVYFEKEEPAHEHDDGAWVTVLEPTCTDKGTKERRCTVCDALLETAEIDALGHDYVNHVAKTPTCTEIGWDEYQTCSRCDYTTYVEKAALGHNFENHTAKAPTCTDIGWDAYQTCSRCDYSTYVEKNAIGHAWGAWTKLDENRHQRFCSNDTAHVEKADHTWDNGVVTKPVTVLEAGEKTFTCTVCKGTKVESISKLPQTNIDTDTVKEKDVAVFSFPELTVADIIATAGTGTKVLKDGKALETSAPVGTGMTIQKADGTEKVIIVIGDIDGSGTVTAADARLALRKAVGLESYTEGSPQYIACDVINDNNVTAGDARMILRAAVGLEDPKDWFKD